MLGRFVTGWLRLETKTSCPDSDLSARAGVLALEREFHPSSISCAVFDARAWDWPLERDCVSDARAGSWKLERETCLQKAWESVSAARAGVLTLERESVSDARAGSLTLERGDFYIKPRSDFFVHFSTSFLSLTFPKSYYESSSH